MILLLILPISLADSIGGSTGHCQEYTEILKNYQSLLVDHQKCLVENGEKVAQIRTFESMVTSGLQQQLDTIRSTHSATIEGIEHSSKQQYEATTNSVNAVKESVKSLESDISNTMENVEAVSNQQTEMRKAQSEIIDTLNSLKKASGEVLTLDTVKSLIQESSEATLQKIDSNKPTKEIPIHITATTTSGLYPTSGTVIFNNVVSDHESGYEPSTGKLTAKKAGYYYISTAVMSYSSSQGRIDLYHNNNLIAKALGGNPSHYQMLPLVATLKLDVGDVIDVRVGAGKIYGSSAYSTFSAFMISAL